MKRFCPYFMCIVLCCSTAEAGPFSTSIPSSGPFTIPAPPLSTPEVTYKTETRTRQVPYQAQVRMCDGKRCWYETRTFYKQEKYTVQVPVASSQYVTGQPEAASTPMDQVKKMCDLVALPRGSVILDPGAGRDARIAIELANRGYRVIAYEIDGARYRSAKKAIHDAGYRNGEGIKLIHGDVIKHNYNVDAVVAYMYPNVLDSIARKLKDKRLRKFISYQHDLESLNMVKNGDIYVWQKPKPAVQVTAPRRYAVWKGQIYYGDYNPGCNCEMCRSIRWQQGL